MIAEIVYIFRIRKRKEGGMHKTQQDIVENWKWNNNNK